MDPFHDSESESRCKILCCLQLPGTEIPKCLKFSHQSFGNSVSFWIGKKISKLAICIALRKFPKYEYSAVCIFINGCKIMAMFTDWELVSEELWLFSVSLGQWNKLFEQNHIELEVIHTYCPDIITWIGVNVECSC